MILKKRKNFCVSKNALGCSFFGENVILNYFRYFKPGTKSPTNSRLKSKEHYKSTFLGYSVAKASNRNTLYYGTKKFALYCNSFLCQLINVLCTNRRLTSIC